MNMRKILLTFCAITTFLCAASSNSVKVESVSSFNASSSGKCSVPPLNQARIAATSVFIGTVKSVTQQEKGKTFEFEVEKYWKGSKSNKLTVTVYESMRFQAFYQVGGKYLVFARANDEGDLTDGRCSRSKDVSDATDDIKGLGKSKKPRKSS